MSLVSKPPTKPDNIFDLSYRGGLPDMLRAIAAKLESREVDGELFTCHVTKEVFELTARILLHPKS